MKINNPKSLNTETLAYMGDAVYEQFIRERLITNGGIKVNLLHRKAIRYVKAGAQAKAIKALFDQLDESEQALVKRARNHKFNSKAKNADAITYKWATAFEALVGYLYLAEENERLVWVIENALDIIDGREA